MKYLYILLSIIFFSCKTDERQENKEFSYTKTILKTNDTANVEIVHTDSVHTKKNLINIEEINGQNLIGKTYQNLDDFEEFKYCRYAGFETLVECEEKKIDIIKIYPDGSEYPYFLILIESIMDNENKKNKIIDVLDLSKERKLKNPEYFVLIADKYIKNKKTIDLPIASITKVQYDEEFFKEIYKIWKVDCKLGKFIEISTEEIKVENEDYYGI